MYSSVCSVCTVNSSACSARACACILVLTVYSSLFGVHCCTTMCTRYNALLGVHCCTTMCTRYNALLGVRCLTIRRRIVVRTDFFDCVAIVGGVQVTDAVQNCLLIRLLLVVHDNPFWRERRIILYRDTKRGRQREAVDVVHPNSVIEACPVCTMMQHLFTQCFAV